MLSRLKTLVGHDLQQTLVDEVAAAGLTALDPEGSPVTEDDVAPLPETVRRYLRFMGVVGRPRDRSFRGCFAGRFRLRPKQRFMHCEAWQYTSSIDVARVFCMRIDFAGCVPMVGRDTYVDGRGRMRGKLLGLVPVADGEGPEFDIGELTTYLNDAILVAPSMLLTDATSWSAVDDRSFDVALTDRGQTVSAHVLLDADGTPTNFSSTDRYAALPGGPVQARWSTPIQGWRTVDGRPVPGRGKAIWHLPEADFTYVEGAFQPSRVAFNVDPDGADAGRLADRTRRREAT